MCSKLIVIYVSVIERDSSGTILRPCSLFSLPDGRDMLEVLEVENGAWIEGKDNILSDSLFPRLQRLGLPLFMQELPSNLERFPALQFCKLNGMMVSGLDCSRHAVPGFELDLGWFSSDVKLPEAGIGCLRKSAMISGFKYIKAVDFQFKCMKIKLYDEHEDLIWGRRSAIQSLSTHCWVHFAPWFIFQ